MHSQISILAIYFSCQEEAREKIDSDQERKLIQGKLVTSIPGFRAHICLQLAGNAFSKNYNLLIYMWLLLLFIYMLILRPLRSANIIHLVAHDLPHRQRLHRRQHH